MGSVTASVAGSVVQGMSPEEKAELKKMQVVVTAVGKPISRRFRGVFAGVEALLAIFSRDFGGFRVEFTPPRPLFAMERPSERRS